MRPALTPLEQQQLHVAAAPAATFWHRVRFDLVRGIVERSGARRVVDVGAGAGGLGDHLAAAPVEYRFSESSPALRAALVARFGAAAEHPADAPIAADAVVTLLDVVEHVEDDVALLTDVWGRMAAGSTLVVTVPAMRWLFSSWDVDLGHRRRYHRRDLVAAVEAAGFEPVHAAYLFPELVPIALLRRRRRSDGTAAEFPVLPVWLDRVAGVVSGVTSALRRCWPVGTSVMVVARRPGSSP